MSPTVLDRARAMGADHGRSLAVCLEPSDTVSAVDAPNPLSGEWAGDPVPADILAAFEGCGMDEDDILDAYEEGFFETYRTVAIAAGCWVEN